MKRLIAIMALTLMVFSVPVSATMCGTWWNPCQGPSGPEGPQGETGLQGEEGIQGMPGTSGHSITYKDLMKYITYGIMAKTETVESVGWVKMMIVSKYEPLIDLLGQYFASLEYVNSLEDRIATLENDVQDLKENYENIECDCQYPVWLNPEVYQ